mmetsp:Transcript_42090/g.121598  ORF Transcript_42090/g.121598 Transcript_42090/m.121598 type:complete len:156 (+) Transcript_42090:530-997(+)
MDIIEEHVVFDVRDDHIDIENAQDLIVVFGVIDDNLVVFFDRSCDVFDDIDDARALLGEIVGGEAGELRLASHLGDRRRHCVSAGSRLQCPPESDSPVWRSALFLHPASKEQTCCDVFWLHVLYSAFTFLRHDRTIDGRGPPFLPDPPSEDHCEA